MKPLSAVAPSVSPQTITRDSFSTLVNGPAFDALAAYFDGYPKLSFIGPRNLAVLYTIIRAMRAQAVAEIGTLFAGTSEVMARALWENGSGRFYTTDPFGADRCPGIIAQWPQELQSVTEYHVLNSMDFFNMIERRRIPLDLVLVDGNHDYEFALFDTQMAARLLRPGGIIVVDNCEQGGPFRAARQFLADDPAWRELSNCLANYSRSNPFDEGMANRRRHEFAVLQSPPFLSIGEGPHSWGQTTAASPTVNGIVLDLPEQKTAGTLHFRLITRAFAAGNKWVKERQSAGKVRLDLDRAATVRHPVEPVTIDVEGEPATFTVEIDMSWEPDPGQRDLALSKVPDAV